MMKEEGRKIAADALKKFDLLEPEVDDFRLTTVKAVSSSPFVSDVTLTSASTRKTHSFSVKRGTKPLEEEEEEIAASSSSSSSSSPYIPNSYHESVLGELLQSHAVRDFCLVGPKGCGKTEVINRFASAL